MSCSSSWCTRCCWILGLRPVPNYSLVLQVLDLAIGAGAEKRLQDLSRVFDQLVAMSPLPCFPMRACGALEACAGRAG